VQQYSRTQTDVSVSSVTNRYVMSGTATITSRNGIRCDATLPNLPASAVFYCDLNGNGTGGEATDGKDIACNYLSWGDLSAYLDWSGLRPMTELEFEKACRGTVAPVANAYPWGTTGIAGGAYTLADPGAANEGIATNYSTTLGNASYTITDDALDAPMRVGIFAANASNTGRITAGATYYGIMEMGGHLMERAVSVGNANGRLYTGTHGNGVLAANGIPDAITWPAPSSADGAGYRGGSWPAMAVDLQTSSRVVASSINTIRNSNFGGRGVRLSP
jgi:formylglycine-generating enzyme required for sulfatase activity